MPNPGPSDETRRVLRKAAELRAAGRSWSQVAVDLQRTVDGLRQLRLRNIGLWRDLYAEAFAELFTDAESEALLVARQGLREQYEMVTRLRAAKTILEEAQKRRPRDEDAAAMYYEAGRRAGLADALREMLSEAQITQLARTLTEIDREAEDDGKPES